MNACYVASEKPFESVSDTRLELIGEVLIYMIIWSTMLYQMSLDKENRDGLSNF